MVRQHADLLWFHVMILVGEFQKKILRGSEISTEGVETDLERKVAGNRLEIMWTKFLQILSFELQL